MSLASPLLDKPLMKKLSQYKHHREKNRLEHVKEVAWLSFLIGKKLSLDCKAIVRGALLHDFFFTHWGEGPRIHGCTHHKIALDNALKIMDLTPKEIDIIKKHMWPLTFSPPRYLESFVISIIDKYCATKDWLLIKGNRKKNNNDTES